MGRTLRALLVTVLVAAGLTVVSAQAAYAAPDFKAPFPWTDLDLLAPRR